MHKKYMKIEFFFLLMKTHNYCPLFQLRIVKHQGHVYMVVVSRRKCAYAFTLNLTPFEVSVLSLFTSHTIVSNARDKVAKFFEGMKFNQNHVQNYLQSQPAVTRSQSMWFIIVTLPPTATLSIMLFFRMIHRSKVRWDGLLIGLWPGKKYSRAHSSIKWKNNTRREEWSSNDLAHFAQRCLDTWFVILVSWTTYNSVFFIYPSFALLCSAREERDFSIKQHWRRKNRDHSICWKPIFILHEYLNCRGYECTEKIILFMSDHWRYENMRSDLIWLR